MTPSHQPSAPEASAPGDHGTQPADSGASPAADPHETPSVIRAAASEFGTGLRSRLGADPNVCW